MNKLNLSPPEISVNIKWQIDSKHSKLCILMLFSLSFLLKINLSIQLNERQL